MARTTYSKFSSSIHTYVHMSDFTTELRKYVHIKYTYELDISFAKENNNTLN